MEWATQQRFPFLVNITSVFRNGICMLLTNHDIFILKYFIRIDHSKQDITHCNKNEIDVLSTLQAIILAFTTNIKSCLTTGR